MTQVGTGSERAVTCDVLVIGSGAGGLAAAVTAARHDLDVIVIEKEPVIGGTSASSGGWMWVPRNPLARRAGIAEDVSAPRTYLEHELGNHFDAPRIDAFLDQAPRMVEFFEQNTALQFVDGNRIPDFHGGSPAAAEGGRSVCAAPYDGRELGPWLAKLRPPLRDISLFGLGIAAGADMWHFLNARRSPRSAAYVVRRLGRHAVDLLRFGRGTQLVAGNALVARLLRSALDLGVAPWTEATARELLRDGDAVRGAVVATTAGDIVVTARRGVVLACGGFPHDVDRRRALFAHAPTGVEHWSAAPATNSGDGIRLAETVGGNVDTGLAEPAAWAPVSLVPHADGTTGVFPHLAERGKPGLIAVTARGTRFVNEADSYHDFMRALFKALAPAEPLHAWLICDHRFQRRYGLGYAKPFPFPLRPYLRSGYLRRGATIEALAQECGIDPVRLVDTVAAYNRDAREGEDRAFGRGSTAYNRMQGDPAHRPNPCVAPIERGPFYAVKVVPGSLGTFAGLKTDRHARVLDAAGAPIPGLYAVGNDMASVMGGHYPSGGITLGPAMTFGYIAARHLAGVADNTNAEGRAKENARAVL